MTLFQDFVNTELPLRTNISALPTADRYVRFTGVGRGVEERTTAQVLADIGAAASSHTHVEADITDLQSYMLDLIDDTTPELSGSLKLAPTGVNARNFDFDHSTTAFFVIQNNGAGDAFLLVHGSIQTQVNLIVVGESALLGNVVIGNGTAADRTITFDALANDGEIKFDEDPGQFLFSHAINVTGNILTDGTVDGRDLQTDGTKLDGIEALADVTDGINVAAAGAAMLASNGTVTGVWTLGTNTQLRFRDTGIFIHSNADGELTIEADVKVNIPADTDITGTLTVTGQLNIDSIRLDGGVIRPATTGNLFIAAGTGGSDTLTLGLTGSDVVFGTTVSQNAVPNTALMFDFGTIAKPFGHGHFGHGVRTKSKTTAVNFGAAPSNVELDTEFGTEAVLGDGFIGVIEDDTGGTSTPWICWVVNGKWAFLNGAFA